MVARVRFRVGPLTVFAEGSSINDYDITEVCHEEDPDLDLDSLPVADYLDCLEAAHDPMKEALEGLASDEEVDHV